MPKYNQGRAFPIENSGAPVAGTSEVQTVTINGSPTGGTFTLSFYGKKTSAIAYNAAASAVQTALQALSTIGSGNVTVTGSAGGPYTVTFAAALGLLAGLPLLVADASGLTGGTPSIAVARGTAGVNATGRGAPVGAQIVDTTTGDRYVNTGTAQAPSWTRSVTGGSQPVIVKKVPLAAIDSAGGVFSWVNPEAGAILVKRVMLDIVTPSSGACSVSVGSTAVSGVTSSANLLDTQSVAAAGVLDNIDNHGTNGKAKQKVASGAWVTGSVASGASAGLVGSAYIEYVLA